TSSSQAESPEVPQQPPQQHHSTRDVTLFHRELQYQGLVIIHQCLALYAYEKLRISLSALASACTSLLWLESTATQAWKKVVRAADVIRTKTNARANELANARASVSGTMANGAVPEPEWELCAPHMPFILYLSAKVHVCQYHWQKIALARTRADAARIHQHRQFHQATNTTRFAREQQQQHHHSYPRSSMGRHAAGIEPQITPSFVQPFSQPGSAVGTPTSNHEGWSSSANGNIHSINHQPSSATAAGGGAPIAVSSASVGEPIADIANAAGLSSSAPNSTPVMTTSGAAALAAAQAAAAQAVASSRHTTPQRSRGSSTTHLHMLGDSSALSPGQLLSAPGVKLRMDSNSNSRVSSDSSLAPVVDAPASSVIPTNSNDDDDGFQMN
ncbi:hypothetical protein IWW38_005857, partial [Coemansia aciculifera]